MKFMGRKEILQLFPECRVPDQVRTVLVEAGVMIATPTDDEVLMYSWDMHTFAAVPDGVIMALYSEMQDFALWYEERIRCLEMDDLPRLSIQDYTMLYERHRLTPEAAPAALITTDTLEGYAKAFARRFISQWRRYQ